jgi:molecular chaperone DnaK
MCFELEKLMKEHDDKLSDADKSAMNQAIEKDREAPRATTPRRSSRLGELEQASHALSKVLYETEDSGGDDDAIDAEFEVKDN